MGALFSLPFSYGAPQHASPKTMQTSEGLQQCTPPAGQSAMTDMENHFLRRHVESSKIIVILGESTTSKVAVHRVCNDLTAFEVLAHDWLCAIAVTICRRTTALHLLISVFCLLCVCHLVVAVFSSICCHLQLLVPTALKMCDPPD
jgi:hypothetical protein